MNQTVENAIVYLIRKERFYANLLKKMTREYTTDVETLGVTVTANGPKLYINPYFLDGIEQIDERAEVLKHECEHLMRGHFDREKFIEPSLHEKEENVSLIDRYKNMTTAYLFNIAEDRAINEFLPKLPKHFKIFDKQGNPILDDNGEPVKCTPVTADSFDAMFPDKKITARQAMEYYYEFLKQNKDKINPNSGDGCIVVTLDDHSKLGESELDPEISKEIIKNAVNEAYKELSEHERGSVPGHVKVLIDKLNRSDKDWRQDIKMFNAMCSTSEFEETRRRRNRRYGLQYPGRRPTVKTHIAVAIDSSGSVRDKELSAMFLELQNLHDVGVKITVIECDAQIQAIYPFDPSEKITVKGRGGTSFEPVFELLKSEKFSEEYGNVDGLIYFTDGEDWGEVKEPNFKVLWALLPNCKVRYDWGNTTYIEVKDE